MKDLIFKIQQVVPHVFVETIEWVENIHKHPGASERHQLSWSMEDAELRLKVTIFCRARVPILQTSSSEMPIHQIPEVTVVEYLAAGNAPSARRSNKRSS